MTDPKAFYRRRLPHILPSGRQFFVTFRLDGSLPKEVVEELRIERVAQEKLLLQSKEPRQRDQLRRLVQRRQFAHIEKLLDQGTYGPTWLKNEHIAQIVYDEILLYDGTRYELICSTLMPNHVHMVVENPRLGPDADRNRVLSSRVRRYPLTDVVRLIKGATARTANERLGLEGRFWQHESFDYVVRDEEELKRIIVYILNNPIKAGLMERWEDWKWTYVKEGLQPVARDLSRDKMLFKRQG